jgi:Methylase involved in ubiquinone/menaquinone biosynthesis
LIRLDNDEFRHNFVRKQIKLLKPGGVFLDVGAGEQRYRKYCDRLHYISQDFNEYDGKGNGMGLQTGSWDVSKTDVVSDITSIPLEDGSVDYILCTEVLEHVPDPASAMKEFSRLLKSGGKVILTAPFCSLTHFAPYHFSTGFNKYWFSWHLEKNGFKDINMERSGNYFKWLGQEVVRIDEILQKCCSEKLNIIDKIARRWILKRLADFDKKDTGSGDILCYEYCVTATKV